MALFKKSLNWIRVIIFVWIPYRTRLRLKVLARFHILLQKSRLGDQWHALNKFFNTFSVRCVPACGHGVSENTETKLEAKVHGA